MKIHRIGAVCFALLLGLGAGAAAQSDPKPAAAVTILLITTDVQVAADGSNTQTVHVEVRAGNDAGALQIGQIGIPFDSTAQDVTVVEAHTLKPDGKTLPVEPSAIYDQAPPGQAALLVTGLRSKLIVFPQFAAGDTAVYTVKTTTTHPNFQGQYAHAALFPKTQAFNEVRGTITAPKSFPLYVESHDVESSKRDDGTDVTYSWHYSAPKPVDQLPVTLSPLDHTPRFFASSFKDYAQLGQAYAALAEPKRVVTDKIKALANDITAGTSDPRTQAQKLYKWVSAHIRYVGIELGTGSYIPHDVDSIVANGYGDCKDHDILLQALLKAKGIDAQSILINGDSSYTLTDIPTFTALDHVITFIPQFNLYLDSTAAVAPFGILPLQEYGKPMVVASTTAARLGKMPVLPPGLAKITLKTVAALDKSGEITGTTTTTASGPYAIALKFIGLQIQGAGPAAATRLLTATGYQNASGTFTMDPPSGFAPDYAISTSFKGSGWEDSLSGKNSFFLPPGLRLLGQTGDDAMGPFNPGTMAADEPTVCFSTAESEDLSLKAPPGYQFDGQPSDVRVETPNLLFVAHWSLAGDTLSVHRDFTSKIDQPFCTGAVRTRSAAALKQISESYDVNISFRQPGNDTPQAKAAQDLDASALNHYNAGEFGLAAADYTKEIALLPDSETTYLNRGLTQVRAGQDVAAIADFDKAIALNPSDEKAYYNRGLAQYRAKQYPAAIADFDKANTLKPDDAEILNERGRSYEFSGQAAPALADFNKALALQSDYSPAYFNRGHIYLNAGQYQQAIQDFDQVIKLKPAYDSYASRGVAYLRLKQYALAIADDDEAIKLKPDDASSYLGRGLAYASSRQYALAIADFDKAIVLKPDYFEAFSARGFSHRLAQQYALAVADFDSALALKPDSVDTLAARAFAHLQAQQYALAVADYDKIIAQKPDANAYLYRGDAKTKMGNKADGDRDIAQAKKLDPTLN